MKPEDIILKYYARKKDISKGRTEARFSSNVSPWFPCQGLGDTLIMTDCFALSGGSVVPRSTGPHFDHVMSRVPGWSNQNSKPVIVDVVKAYWEWDVGAGHVTQRIARLMGLPFRAVTKPAITSNARRVPGRVLVHWEAGAAAEWQRNHVHPMARQVYPESMDALRRFAKSRSDLDWTTVGVSSFPEWARAVKVSNAVELIDHVATCEWFVGICSGPMHVATALGLKCIIIVNFPDPRKIMLPTLKVLGMHEEEWFYPQNVHLHQDGAGHLVPKFSIRSLAQAFEGEVYPFWKTDWCKLLEK